MSPGTQGAAALPGSGCRPGRRAGLLEKLIAAVRPQFRTDVLVFDPRDPVFGGPACAAGCQRPARRRGLCPGHYERWRVAGKPDLAEFAAATPPDMIACRQLPACEIAGCLYGQTARGICERHRRQWQRACCPELVSWRASAPPPPSPRPATCRMDHCDLWACPSSLFCRSHHVRWTKHGRPDADQFAISCQDAGRGAERIDLRQLPGTLRLEVQYVLQGRRDEQRAPLVPATVQRILGDLAATGVTSLLDRPEPAWEQFGPRRGRGCGWRAFALDARQRIEALAVGSGWDIEYPRDAWRLRNLGITSATATIRFGKIPQTWLKDLAKRWRRQGWPPAPRQAAWPPESGRSPASASSWHLRRSQPAGSPTSTASSWNATWPACTPNTPDGRPTSTTSAPSTGSSPRSGGRLGRHPLRQHGHLPRGLAQAAQAPAARPRRADRGPAGDKRRPGPVGQPGLPADHRDPDPLRPGGRRRCQAPLQLPRHRRRRRPLPAVLQPQDETGGAGPYR